MCGILVKCAALIVMIHALRALGRLAGPRWSGLALGLPSTTAIVLFSCGCERGSGAAIVMAESSVLGMVAAVALPLAYARAVGLGWRLPAALTASIAGYVVIASGLGCLPAIGAVPRLAVALFALLCSAAWVGRIPVPLPDRRRRGAPFSTTQTMALRTGIPVLYVVFLGIAERLAGPSWAGLASTFPSMSLVVLMVTHLEDGPGEASRIAQVLPTGNLSTLAFLAAFRFTCNESGLAGGMIAGYAAALGALWVIEGIARRPEPVPARKRARSRTSRPGVVAWRIVTRAGPRRTLARTRTDAFADLASRYFMRKRPSHRGCFSPLVETMAW
jgi:hypothetical protein